VAGREMKIFTKNLPNCVVQNGNFSPPQKKVPDIGAGIINCISMLTDDG
jgi:hypothetical protein